MASDLVVGAWRNGLDDSTATFVNEANKRANSGFRQLAYESTVQALTQLLDGYDTVAEELLTTCECGGDDCCADKKAATVKK